MKEKRNDQRVAAEALVFFSQQDQESQVQNEGMAKTCDLSAHGAKLEMQSTPEVGTKLQLTLSFKDKTMDLQGKTVWSKPGVNHSETGIEIENPPDTYDDLLKEMNS